MTDMTKKTFVWSIFTRIFHILLIICVSIAYITSDFDNLLSFHAAFGYTMVVLFLFRIVWGFMNVRYSKFSDFTFNLHDLFDYLTHIFHPKKSYIGHNPAASWAVVAMIILGILTGMSGALVYGTQEGMGIFSFLNHTYFKEMELFEELHEVIANAFMLVVLAHIAGVLVDKFVHKGDAITSMIDGTKNANATNLILTFGQKIFGFVWVATSILFLLYLLSSSDNPLLKDGNTHINYEQEHALFFEECSSCHILYPPFLLPENSWKIMMNNLEDHFGDDASLEEVDRLSIKNYLLSHAAQHSTKESALKIMQSMKNKDTIAITQTPYWIQRHKNIDKALFQSAKVQKKSNCKACHKNFEHGLLNDKDIHLPKE